MQDIIGEYVVNSDFEILSTDQILDKNILYGLYFSASWCRPCQQFTRTLFHFYTKVNVKDKKFEIVFVSKDKDMNQFSNYFNVMPWYAIEFQDKIRLNALFRSFKIPGIPHLCILNNEGKLISNTGTYDIQTYGINAYEYWRQIENS